jgi:hypothetical protein
MTPVIRVRGKQVVRGSLSQRDHRRGRAKLPFRELVRLQG